MGTLGHHMDKLMNHFSIFLKKKKLQLFRKLQAISEDVLGLENQKIMHIKLFHLCPVKLNIRWYFSSLKLDKLVFWNKMWSKKYVAQ